MAAQRNRVRELIVEARSKVGELGPMSALRVVATGEWFDQTAADYPPERAPASISPLLLHIYRLPVEQLRAFDSDLVHVSTLSPAAARTTAFVTAGTRADRESVRQWYAGLAELVVLANLVDHAEPGTLKIEPPLPNGKRADASLVIGGRRTWVECTALTTSNEALDRDDPAKNVQVGYGDPYSDTRRMYRKTFDKVVGVGDNPKSQLHPDEPSLLVVVEGVLGAGYASEGTTWALQQMLDPATRETRSPASFQAWLDHDYPDHAGDVVAQLEHLSGIALHGYTHNHRRLKLNVAADDAHRLTADEAATITRMLEGGRPWTAWAK